MNGLFQIAAAASIVGSMLGLSPPANAQYSVKEIGSFCVGGEERSITGQPMVEVSTTAGMPVAKRDPNGQFEIGPSTSE